MGAKAWPCYNEIRIIVRGVIVRLNCTGQKINKKQHSKMYKVIFEPRREKTRFFYMRDKDADQLPNNREADQRLCFHYAGSTIPLLSESEISSL